MLHAAPFGNQHEQRLAVLTAEHTREAELVELDPLQYFAALPNAPATRLTVLEGWCPDGTLRVKAHAVTTLSEVCPDAAVRQAAIRGDVEGCEPGRERFGD